MDEAASLIDGLVRRFAEARPLRAGSFIVTVYGDAVAPRGGELALASLIRIVEPFGISETLVRTAVSRLVQDGWLQGHRIGRRSFYRLTETGAERFADATRRIYAAHPPAWDGDLHMVVIPQGPARDGLRRDLVWSGFGTLGPGTVAHPAPDREALNHILRDVPPASAPLLLRSRVGAGAGALRAIAAEAWTLDALAARYDAYRAAFEAIARALSSGRPVDDSRCLSLRLLLIHEYRKAVLRDPHLPPAFLPDGWSGLAAQSMTAGLYRAIAGAAERHLTALGECASGPLQPADSPFSQRFGGHST